MPVLFTIYLLDPPSINAIALAPLLVTTTFQTRNMLITKTYHDVPSALDANGQPMRIFIIAPSVPGYPNAKFPGKTTWIIG